MGDESLQDIAFKVIAHATCTMTARQQQRIERHWIDGIPALRRDIVWIDDHLSVGLSCIAIRSHQKP